MTTNTALVGADGTVSPLRPPRRYLCVPLPDCEHFLPPTDAARCHELTARVREALNCPHLTPHFAELDRHFWLCAFFHASKRPRRTPTYEHDHPSAVTYIPRSAVLLLIDWRHALLYLSAPKAERAEPLLATLNGTLLPRRHYRDPFPTRPFKLAPIRYLDEAARHPCSASASWSHLTLKGYTCREAGFNGPLSKRIWPEDGFEPFACGCEAWPVHLNSLTFGIHLHARHRVYTAELFEGTAILRATITPTTRAALSRLISITV